MKNLRRNLFPILALFAVLSANAQFDTDNLGDLGTIFQGGQQDAETYTQLYFEPAILAFGNGMAGGWTNTAKTHKLFGFDLTVSMNLAAIPKGDASFNFNSAGFNRLLLQSGDPNLPTFAGGDTDAILEFTSPGPTLEIDGTGGQTIEYTGDVQFNAPGGLNLDFLFLAAPVPTVNAGIGLIKNTDLKVRFVPPVGDDSFEFNLFGVGLMHDVKQHIPGLNLVPIDIAVFAGLTKMTMNVDIEDNVNGDDELQIENGAGEFSITSTTIQAIASKKIAFFTPYVSIGYNIIDNSFKTTGRFYYQNSFGQTVDFDNLDASYKGGNTARTTIGFQLKLGPVTLHTDYTIQKYSTLTAGVGISVR